MVSFQCSFGSTDLCLDNATCVPLTRQIDGPNGTTLTQFTGEVGCQCPGSFQHDFVFYHFPSCTLPPNAYLGYFIYYTIACVILIFLLTREFWTISHGKTKMIAIANVCDLILTWCQGASVYFQNGAFEGNAVFASLAFAVTFYMGGRLSISFMETLHAVRRVRVTRFREVLKACTVFACITSFATGMVMVGTCRSSNASYNTAAWVMEFQLILWSVLFCSIIAYYTSHLLGNIEHASTLRGTNNESKRAIKELIRKVTFIRNASLYNAIFISLIGFPKAIAFLILGSVPYQWVFGYFFLYQGLIVTSCGVLMFVRHTNRKRKGDKKRERVGGDRDDNSSPAGEDTNAPQDGTNTNRQKRKEHYLHTNGKNGRTWLFRGSSLMTKQGNKDITKMTYDPQGDPNASPMIGASPAIANGVPMNGSPRPKRMPGI